METKTTPEELEKTMRSIFGIDGRGLIWKAQRLYDLLQDLPVEEIRHMCEKLKQREHRSTPKKLLTFLWFVIHFLSERGNYGYQKTKKDSQPVKWHQGRSLPRPQFY
jgi:hypothetical protein